MRLAFDLAADWGGFRLAAAAELELAGVTALFGPNGAGKTSILAAIAGFRPGLGRIEVDGAVWQDGRRALPAHRRPVGMVFQDGRLFEHLTVGGNLAYAARRADPAGPAIDAGAVADVLGLAGLTDRRPSTLSGGERQRIAIARALMTRPRLLLMDEPLAALDRARKAAILPLIGALPERFGAPVLMVSHQLDEIVQIATTLIAVRDGQVTGVGPVAEMIERMDPAITGHFEAGSVLEGTVADRAADFAMIAVALGPTRLWMPDTGAAAPGERVRIRVRARDVSLARAPVEGLSIRNQIPVTVRAVEPEPGAFAEIRLDCAGQALRARISRMALDELGLGPGDPAWALVKSVAFDRRLTRG